MRVKDAVGRWGEQVAAHHLGALGMTIIDRNWRCHEGELDIVALDGSELVCIEVKTRSSTAFGLPSEAVTPAKQARLRTLSLRWVAAHRNERSFHTAIRFDVVSVVRLRDGRAPTVDHVRGAF